MGKGPERPEALRGGSENEVGVSPNVAYRVFEEETVVVDLAKGAYYGLNLVGGRMLAALDECATIGEAIDRVASEFDEPRERVERDMQALCASLLERNLIEVSGGTSSRGA